MSRRKGPRRPRADERALWDKVAATTTPLDRRTTARGDLMSTVTPQVAEPEKVASKAAQPSFRIGEKTPPRPEPVTPSDTGPVAMDHKAFTKLSRGKMDPEARIDLHGMTLDQAEPALAGFLRRAHGSGKRLVLVITGKGRASENEGPIPERPGRLRRQVPIWLSRGALSGLVLQVVQAHRRHGGDGAYYVYLRRSR